MANGSPRPDGPVPPVPTPMTWNIGVAEVAPGLTRIVVQIHSATGTAVFFLEPAFAEQISQMLAGAATSAAAAGLVVPSISMADIERIRRDNGALS